ncbi:HAMP domain-containing protein [Ruminiclostridium herbifermentans]|uniref:histidine kinase n=1 Tax=Ruminiclostridium herbifermentans TaxID=2488810 RepID=A0A4U7JLC3_9FIRM|nr:adenylate/guanylate cyclase domain-containing protein [Ruminiclostridium herbifermentans]QNU66035.1 HAMP domain-containing protein [Ruminiclostridium herbifermentans]
MRSKIILFTLLMSVLSLTIICYFLNKDLVLDTFTDYSPTNEIYFKSPLNNSIKFSDISFATSDTQKNMYAIDNNRNKIMKIDSSGNLVFKLDKDSIMPYLNDNANISANPIKEIIYNIVDFSVDENQNLYILVDCFGIHGRYVHYSLLLSYNPFGKFNREVYCEIYDEKSSPISVGRLKGLQVKNGFLYFYIKNVEDSRAKIKKYNCETFTFENCDSDINLNYIADIIGTDTDIRYISTTQGNIFSMDTNGNFNLIYPSDKVSNQRYIPFNLYKHNDDLLFCDKNTNSIIRIKPDGQPETLYSLNFLRKYDNDQASFFDIRSIGVNSDGNIMVAASEIPKDSDKSINTLTIMTLEGKVLQTINQAKFSAKDIFLHMLICLLAILVLLCILYLFIKLVKNVLRKKLWLKLLSILLPVMILTLGFSGVRIYTSLNQDIIESEMNNKLKLIVHSGVQHLDVEKFNAIKQPSDYMNNDYNELWQYIYLSIENNRNGNLDTESEYIKSHVDSSGITIALYKYESGKLFTCIDFGKNTMPFTPIVNNRYFIPENMKDTKAVNISIYNEKNTKFAVTPIFDGDGKTVGFYQASLNMEGIQLQALQLINQIIYIMIGAVIIFTIMMYFLIRKLLKPLKELEEGANKLANEEWDTRLSVRTQDEIGKLCNTFNDMTEFINKYRSASDKFVPSLFLKNIGLDNITEVELSGIKKDDMSILYLSIRSFFDMEEAKIPHDSFELINKLLGIMGQVVRTNDGFVSQSFGANLIAVFPRSASDALKSAVEIEKEMLKLNISRNKQGKESIDIGIGIHKGSIMMGIVGESERMEASVVSYVVNQANELENLARKLGASILVSKNVITDMDDSLKYKNRFVGKFNIGEVLEVYDVFEGEEDFVKRLKEDTKELFDEGVSLYLSGKFNNARRNFVEVIKQNHDDIAAKLYFFECDKLSEKYQSDELLKDWNGVLKIK